MKQRLAIASALLGNPEVLVLDEPTNGLDPQGIAEVRQLILELGQDGKTILLASHLLDEVEKVCTHVAVIKNGNLLAEGPVNQVLAGEDQLELAASDLLSLERHIQEFPGIGKIAKEGDLLILSLTEKVDGSTINKYLFEKGITLSHLAMRKKSLEAQFLELTAE
jgi:ABC-2 type transport system ATP-binding protein